MNATAATLTVALLAFIAGIIVGGSIIRPDNSNAMTKVATDGFRSITIHCISDKTE